MKVLGMALVICCFAGIGYLFWQEDMKYALPTPRPVNLKQVNTGTTLHIPGIATSGTQPIFLHFFNADCPCSRFNMDHFRNMVREHSDEASFYVILQGENASEAEKDFRRYDLPVEVIFDSRKKIANSCGVYSTPQALVLKADGSLYFRGNYNKSRYCTLPGTNYAEIALRQAVRGYPPPSFEPAAYISYGCELPGR